eukprot:scaffold226_cov167-Pinguiococcus_pyrenoidosus.AAC.6
MLVHGSTPRLAKRAHRVHFAQGFNVARFGCPAQLLVPGQSARLVVVPLVPHTSNTKVKYSILFQHCELSCLRRSSASKGRRRSVYTSGGTL